MGWVSPSSQNFHSGGSNGSERAGATVLLLASGQVLIAGGISNASAELYDPGTGTPPPAGHDRCIVPIKPEHVDAWSNPDPANLAAQYAILDNRERPYYEHRMAA